MLHPEDIVRLLIATALGALIGAEREFERKPAGFRTNCLICVGSALFTIISVRVDAARGDQARIAAQIVSGIGFLGAGVIMREQGRVTGLTTAAGIWMVAALGMAVGAGLYATAIATTLLAVIVLRLFDRLEFWIDWIGEPRTYEIHVVEPAAVARVAELMQSSGMRAAELKRMRRDGTLVSIWGTRGKHGVQQALVERLLAEPLVSNVTW